MKCGDTVRLIGIPPGVKDDGELQTRSLFEKCLGKKFIVSEVKTVSGLSQQLAQLEVGHILGQPSYVQSIWVEREFLQIEH